MKKNMQCSKLQNYLRSYRKRCGLSQAEAAFLAGCKSSSKISCYERQGRLPGLETLFAFEAIYGASVRDLFAGLAQQIETDVAARKRELAQTWYARRAATAPPAGLAHARQRLSANTKTK